MIKCEEFEKLIEESGKLLGQLQGWEDELRMTPKNHPSYAEKARGLKMARGRFNECQTRIRKHMKDHGCCR
jgi:hypothetical protein